MFTGQFLRITHFHLMIITHFNMNAWAWIRFEESLIYVEHENTTRIKTLHLLYKNALLNSLWERKSYENYAQIYIYKISFLVCYRKANLTYAVKMYVFLTNIVICTIMRLFTENLVKRFTVSKRFNLWIS